MCIRDSPYGTVTQEDNTLYQGEKKVATPGQAGERTIVNREKLVNGEVTETETISDERTKEPVDEVVLVGTKQKPAQNPAGSASVGGNGYLIDHNGPVSYTHLDVYKRQDMYRRKGRPSTK